LPLQHAKHALRRAGDDAELLRDVIQRDSHVARPREGGKLDELFGFVE